MLAALTVLVLAQPPQEVNRVQAHFAAVDQALRGAAPHLDPERQARRSHILAELREYAAAALFPQNRGFHHQTPYFVDEDGTRCAVAHLLEVTGEEDLMWRVAATNNNARVPQLRTDDEFLAWLDIHGLTVADATRIQPHYTYYASDCVCDSLYYGGNQGAYRVERVDGVLRPTEHIGGAELLEVGQELTHVHQDFSAPLTGDGPWYVGAYEEFPLGADQARVVLFDIPVEQRCEDAPSPFAGRPKLTGETLAQILADPDNCRDILSESDPRWGLSEDTGCSQAPGPLALFIALALVPRRRRAQPPAPR